MAVVRGDDELSRLNITDEVAIMKIDVEGLEPDVLRGFEQTIRKHHPIIFWEAFSHEVAGQSVEILKQMGYQHFYHLTTNKFDSRLANKLFNAFGKSTYLVPLDSWRNLDGMNVAMNDAPEHVSMVSPISRPASSPRRAH